MSSGWAGPSSWKLTRFFLFCLSFLTTLTTLFNAGFFLVAAKLFFSLTVKGLVALTQLHCGYCAHASSWLAWPQILKIALDKVIDCLPGLGQNPVG